MVGNERDTAAERWRVIIGRTICWIGRKLHLIFEMSTMPALMLTSVINTATHCTDKLTCARVIRGMGSGACQSIHLLDSVCIALQWQHNSAMLPVTDVVVDPHISMHLRPHQRDGVLFLYQCVMGMKSSSGCGAILAYVISSSSLK